MKRLINRVSVEAVVLQEALGRWRTSSTPRGCTASAPDESRAKASTILRRLGIDRTASTSRSSSCRAGCSRRSRSRARFLTAPMLLLLDEPTTGPRHPQQARGADVRARPARRARRDDPADDARPRRGRAPRPTASGSCTTGVSWPKARADELRARHGATALEDVFMSVTGRRLDEADAAAEERRSDDRVHGRTARTRLRLRRARDRALEAVLGVGGRLARLLAS